MSRVYEAYQTQATTAVKKAEPVTRKDQVALSSEAKDFVAIQKMLSDVPEVRQDKINDIKARMASGSYNVKAEEVAEKIVSQFSVRG